MEGNIQIFLQLLLAVILGSLMGLEREAKGKEAGLQTYSLVCLGSCLFTLITVQMFNEFFLKFGNVFDVSVVIRSVAVGIGFLGAGVIFQRPDKIEGLTTAAGLWAAAAVGLSIGFELYFLAFLCTFFVVIILGGFGTLEDKYLKCLKKK